MTLHPFDLTGPLPSGTTILEASAGTGKTYTIAGLVTRWVAESRWRLPQLLVVTFTRAATAELRDRVRGRLVAAADHLDEVLRGADPDHEDRILALLAAAPDPERRRRLEALTSAITEVDVATISTIHGFCQHVLDGLGIASELDREAELVDDLSELIEEVADDLLVDTYLDAGDRPRVTRRELLELGATVVGNPATPLAPSGDVGPEAGLRRHLAQRFRAEVASRARRRRQLSYDDLLTQLDATLRDPHRGGAARDTLRDRYKVTLIDEFQDTDPLQWRIVSETFSEPGDDRALVLIGDPKQAIYSFRGADVYAYLEASTHAAQRWTLGTNWRSDAGLLDAFDVLYDGASFGDDRIPYRQVQPAPGHARVRFEAPPVPAPLRLRWLPHHPELLSTRGGLLADPARDHIARDLAGDVVRLLHERPHLIERNTAGTEVGGAPIEPRDIAVLVRTNAQATIVQDALRAVGVPSVIGGVESVFSTPAATEWRRLLEALDRPAASTGARALALTSWVGWTGDEVADASETDWEQLHGDVHNWAATFRQDGLAAMHRRVVLERGLRSRLLEREGGERTLADIEHIGELLHAAATAEHLGLAGLLGWLQERMDEAANEQQDDRLRRLETDDEAVQILTIHRSKGLEFPVVYLPYLWSAYVEPGSAPIFHDDDGQRRIDVGGPHHDTYDDHEQLALGELRGEQLRLVYVAMTRARHQVVAWYASAGKPKWSGLGRLLLCRDDQGRVQADVAAPAAGLDDDELEGALTPLATRSGGRITVERVPERHDLEPWQPEAPDHPGLDRARFDRGLDTAWRRTSYSALTRLDDAGPLVGSEPITVGKDDEAIGDEVATAVGPAADPDPLGLGQIEVPLAELAGGTQIGTYVHRVLEHADFAAEDLESELLAQVAATPTSTALRIGAEQFVSGLASALRTPLGLPHSELRLADVSRADRLDEVEFELPLDLAPAGSSATVGDVADLLRRHLPADDPLSAYPDRLPTPLLDRELRGFLGGSIDLVLRRVGPNGGPVFHVADYKTNRLGTWGEPLTLWDYRPAALAEAMMHGHYPVQALLYSVALHRMLRWRLPGYDPGQHLGSVLYLFVRGMAGPDAPQPDGRPCGVFAWSPPTDLIDLLSTRLHGAAA
ncbi:MAG: UvrD-helicase domain-containing protein [Nitriliruptorales bacterium]|nr:UvrD-helicase domain-containing protein [Nitriliruptorales bacterium]